MDLERAIGVLRPRTGWEAIDFGWLLARRLWRPLMGAWWLVLGPLALALIATNWNRPWLAVLVLLMIRPLLDTPLLFVLSRGLFAQPQGLGALLPELRRTLGIEWMARVAWRRLSPVRSYVLPISQLEGLRGRERRARVRVLVHRGSSEAWGLLLICGALELLAMVGLFGMVFLMLPEPLHPDWAYFFDDELWQVPRWGRLVFAGQLLAMTLGQPLYVAGGFGLYLNRRTILEGWDIQLAFRRLGARAKSALVALLCVGMLGWSGPASAQGSEQQETDELTEFEEIDAPELTAPADVMPPVEGDLAADLEEILASRDFGWEEEVQGWQRREVAEKTGRSFGFGGAILGQVLEVLLWLAALVAIGAIGAWLIRSGAVPALPQSRQTALPTELLGMDVRPESLPDDVPTAARALLASGDRAGALSLLYRAALARLIHGLSLELDPGATENDCVRAVRRGKGPSRWFEALTQAWQSEAYAHRPMADGAIGELIDEWTLAMDGER